MESDKQLSPSESQRFAQDDFVVPEPPSPWFAQEQVIEDNRIGQLLLRNRVLTLAQLEDCLATQTERPGTLLGELVVEKGFASLESVHDALKTQLAELRLGQILLRTRCVSQGQLDIALVEQENTGELLGTILISFGFCTPEMIGWAIDQQNKDR